MPVRGEGWGRERGMEQGELVVSSCRHIICFLYCLADEAPCPLEYGSCCRFGWFLPAISDHVGLGSDGCVGVCPHAVFGVGCQLLVLPMRSWLVVAGRGGLFHRGISLYYSYVE